MDYGFVKSAVMTTFMIDKLWVLRNKCVILCYLSKMIRLIINVINKLKSKLADYVENLVVEIKRLIVTKVNLDPELQSL